MLQCKVWNPILWMIAKYENRKSSKKSRHKEKDRFAITYEARRTINSSSNFISFGMLFCPNNYVMLFFLFASFCNTILYL